MQFLLIPLVHFFNGEPGDCCGSWRWRFPGWRVIVAKPLARHIVGIFKGDSDATKLAKNVEYIERRFHSTRTRLLYSIAASITETLPLASNASDFMSLGKHEPP